MNKKTSSLTDWFRHELEASGTPHSHGKLEHNSLAGFSLSRSDTRSFKLRDSQQSEDMAKLPDLDENFSIVGRQRRKNSNHSEPSRLVNNKLDGQKGHVRYSLNLYTEMK